MVAGSLRVVAVINAAMAAIPLPASAQTKTLSGTTTGAVSVPATSGAPSIVGNSVLTGTATFRYTGGAPAVGAIGTMTSNLSGAGSLWFSSPATLVIAGSNTYSGGTSVTDGGLIDVTTGGSISHASSDLRVGVDGGPGSTTLSGGSVGVRNATIGSGQDVTSSLTVLSGTCTGSGALTIASAGATAVFQLDGGSVSVLSSTIGTGASDIGNRDVSHGSALINGGTWITTNGLVLGTAGGNGSLTLTGGAVNSGSGTIGAAANSVGTADISAGTWTNSGDLTVGGAGNGTLTVGGTGTGTVKVGGTLSRDVNNGMINLLSGGTLQIGVGGATGNFGFDLTNDGTLVFNRSTTYDHTNVIDGSGAVVKRGSGTLVLSAANSWSGGTSIDGGVVELGSGDALGSSGPISFGGGTLQYTSANTIDYSGRFSAATGQAFSIDTNGEAVEFATALDGTGNTFTKIGSGTLTLSADNLYDGVTTVSAGTLRIGSGGASGLVAGNIVTNASLVFDRSDALPYSGTISGSGALAMVGTGTLILGGDNSYTGGTRLDAGTLALSGTGSIGTGGLNLGTTGSPGVFDIAGLTAGSYSLPSSASLAGVGTLSGNGKLLAVLGSLAPGNSAGTITVGTGLSLDLSNSGSSVFEITDPAFTAGTYDLVNGDGSVVFGGILSLAFSGGTYADGTDVLQIFANVGGLSGRFSAVNFTGLAAGQSATFDPTTGAITVVPEPSTSASLLIGLACGGYSMLRRRKGA